MKVSEHCESVALARWEAFTGEEVKCLE